MKEKELELQGNLDGLKKEMIALKLKSDEDPTLQVGQKDSGTYRQTYRLKAKYMLDSSFDIK